MTVKYIDTLDVFQRGNFVQSFDTIKEIEKYFNARAAELKWAYSDENDIVEYLNAQGYSVIASKRVEFSL